MGRWEEKKAQWYELVMLYCDLCGRIIPKFFWAAEVRGQRHMFCGPECERLYREYWLPQQAGDTAEGTDGARPADSR